MGKVSFVIPETTTNLLDDPSFESEHLTDSWTIANSGGVSTFVHGIDPMFGTYHAEGAIVFADTWVRIYQTVAVTNVTYTLSAFIKIAGSVPTNAVVQAYFNTAIVNWDTIEQVRGEYYLCQYTGTATAGNRDFGIHVTTGDDVQVDGVQLEQKAYRTTFCDGDQDGCEWLAGGVPPNTTSARSKEARAGGRVVDVDDLECTIQTYSGLGVPPITHNIQQYALMPGAELQSEKIQPRIIQLSLHTVSGSEAELYDARMALWDALKPDRVATLQPVILRYQGDTLDTVETLCYYDAGMEGQFDITCYDTFVVRLISYDPYWYAIGNSAALLDHNDVMDVDYIVGRINGEWDQLGMPAPVAGRTIYVIAPGPDGKIYVGGNWTTAAGMDYIGRYDPNADAWEIVGGAAALGATVFALKWGPDGKLYIGGSFPAPGLLVGDCIIRYDIDTDAFEDVGPAGFNSVGGDVVYAITFDHSGIMYVGGNFLNVGGANGDNFTRLRAGAWNDTAHGLNNIVYTLATSTGNAIIMGGLFTATTGGVPIQLRYVAYIAAANVDTLGAIVEPGSGFNGTVRSIVVTPENEVYAAGDFWAANDGTLLYHVAKWDFNRWIDLDGGTQGITVEDAYCLAVAPDGLIYCVGDYTTMGALTQNFVDHGAKWNGYVWVHLDFDLRGEWAATVARAVACAAPDPVVERNYDVYIASNIALWAQYAGTETVANFGTAEGWPRVIVERIDTWQTEISQVGNVYAHLKQIRNETTGDELSFDYGLLSGEVITIDMLPQVKDVRSTWRPVAISELLQPSDLGNFSLVPDVDGTAQNLISAFIDRLAIETGDNNNQLSGWEFITGYDLDNTDGGIWYVSILDTGGGPPYSVYIYRDAGKAAGDLVGHTAWYAAAGVQNIIADNASGLGGRLRVDAAVAADADIVVYIPICRTTLQYRPLYHDVSGAQ